MKDVILKSHSYVRFLGFVREGFGYCRNLEFSFGKCLFVVSFTTFGTDDSVTSISRFALVPADVIN